VQFHLGKPILVMIAIALISGVGLALRSSPPRAQLVWWTFADSHAAMYRGVKNQPRDDTLVAQFERDSGKSVQVKLVNGAAENLRLTAMFDRPIVDPNQPDVAEIARNWRRQSVRQTRDAENPAASWFRHPTLDHRTHRRNFARRS